MADSAAPQRPARHVERTAVPAPPEVATAWLPEPADSPAPTPVTGLARPELRRSGETGPDPLGGSPVPSAVVTALRRRSGGGSPLPTPLADTMGGELMHDLSAVRVHTDPEAHSIARSVQAIAFTHGTDIYFQQGSYAPDSRRGQHLLAHELSHVAAEACAGSSGRAVIGRADDPAERAADASADRIVGALRRRAHAVGPTMEQADAAPERPSAATSASPVDGVVRRTVQIVFESQQHEMEDPPDPTTARIQLVDAQRDAGNVAAEDGNLDKLQWSHTTSHTVLTNMWVRALDQKTWLEAWTVVRGRYRFLRDLVTAWYADATLNAGARAWIRNALVTELPLRIAACDAQLTRGGFDLAAGVWAARPLAGDASTWVYYDHAPTQAADGVAPATHLIKPWKPLLDSEHIAELQTACEAWMTLRGQIPWTSVKVKSYVTGDRTGPDGVEGALGAVAGQLALSNAEARTIARPILKTFDFFPTSLSAARTITHAAACAARHLVEHFEYHPDIVAAWRPTIQAQFLALWRRKIADEINYEETLTEQREAVEKALADGDQPKKKSKVKSGAKKNALPPEGRATAALHELDDDWATVTTEFNRLYTALSAALT